MVKGSITGIAGQNLTLSVNGQTQVITGSPVEYAAPIKDGDSYVLAIAQQPLGPQQLCSFTSETTGVVQGGVLPFALQCATGTHTVSGSIAGLAGSGLQLQINGGEIIPASGSAFAFATKITDGQAFNVQVKVQPSTPVQICTPEYNVGLVAGANVTNVAILCSTVPYSVGGYVNGLANGQTVTLQVNGGQNTVRSSDGFFLFPTPLADQTHFDVTVLNQPTGQTCSVQSGSGAIDGRGSYATYIQCSTAAWTVSGVVSGLNGGYVTLVTSAGEYKPVVANGAFTFSQKFASGSAYAVEVFRNPASPAQTCTVMNGTGTNITGDVGSVSVTCSATGYTVGGSLTGLTASGLVLRLNGTSDLIVTVGSSSYAFPDSVATGGTYSVAVASQPTGLKCTVTPATAAGTAASANVTNIAVTCQTGYTVGGTVTGLNGTNLVLRNTVNGGTNSDFVISGGTFTFPELLVAGDTYSVQILNHPESPYQTCGASNSAGTIAAANITNVAITCTNVVVQFQATSGSAAEANATIDIPITITPASARPLNLTLALAAGTAASGVDFNFLTPTIAVPVGATSVNAQIQVFQDSAYEPNETVVMNLTGADKAALGTQVNYTHTINNDDGVSATKVVVTNSGSNFTAGGTTSITVQVQDALNNLATTDSTTQITFTPTGAARINAVTTGTGDGSYGVAGGVETVTVTGGVATVTIANTVAQSVQIAVTNNAALTNPANIALTSSAGAATQVVITSAAPDTTAGGTSSLTVQVQDANGNLVTGTSTVITFTPTLGGTVSGVTTGTGDGSYGVAAGSESVTVSGGIATITVTNNTAQTYQIAISNNGGLANPANDSVTITPAAASQLALTGAGSNFITGGTTTLIIQVQDSLGNLRNTDSATQVTFAPTNSGRITAVTTGTGDGSYGVAGGAETVTVAGGVATVTVGDAVSETFQVAFTNNGGLTNPANRSLTASNSATQVAITQSGGSFIVSNSTTLTVQVQTSGGTLVSSDNSTQITFTPTNSGRVTGVTTGTGDGSYGIVGGSEIVTVAGGIATITLSNTVAETFQVAITNNAALSNPANDSITATAATGAVITKAEYFDINHNGKIDRVKITFDKNVDETTISGDITTQFLIAGYSGVALVSGACIDESYPTNGNCTDAGEVNDTATNNIVWLSFTEGAIYDTGATPDLTGVDVSLKTTVAQGGCFIYTSGGTCATQTSADFGTAAVAEADKAPPVFVAAWSDPIIDAWQVKLQFSEAVDLSSGVAACSGTATNAAFTYNNVGGSGASALRTDFADNNGCDSTSGSYYIIPRVNARFTLSDLKTDTLALASTFYDTLGQGTISTTKTIGYDPNLELYYPMDAAAPVSDTNSLVHDVTANGRNGTISNGTKLVRDMSEGNYQAYQFDGVDDLITVTGYKGVTGTADRTISAWVWSEHGYYNGANHNRCQIVTWGSGNVYGMALNHEGGIGQRGGLTLTAGGSLTNTSVTPVTSGGWMHVAITWANDGTPNASDAILYINGVAQTVTNAGGAINTGNTNDMIFGRGFTVGDANFRGKMDEMRIYSRALSASEIKKLATKVPGGLVAQYPLEPAMDVVNATTTDLSGNGNSITIGNNSGSDAGDPVASNSRYYPAGNTSSSYAFDGINHQMKEGATNINLANASFTISAWAKKTTTAWQVAAMLGTNANNQGVHLVIDAVNTAFCAFFGNDLSGGTIADSNWHLYTCTYDATTNARRFFIDGRLAGSDTSAADFAGNSQVTIGSRSDSQSRLQGNLNDIRFYNRALTDGEVAALATELDRGLVAYYPLDDAAATARDYSGSGNHLAATNGPTYVSDRNGISSGAYNFVSASTQYLTTSSAANLPQSSANRTVCAWVKGGQLSQSVVSHGGTGATAIFNLKIHSNYGGPAITNSQISAGVESTLTPPIYGWYHLCGLVGNAASPHQVWVNGFLEASGNIGFNSTGTELRIGANTLNGQTWNGSIDDVRIYDRALSAAEIRTISGFYPAHLSNIKTWVDASRIGDPNNTNPGADLKLWKDLSLNSSDVTQNAGGSSNIPDYIASQINGLPAVNFTGSEYSDIGYSPNLNTTAHTELTVFRASGGVKREIITQSNSSLIYGYNAGPVLQTGIGGSTVNSNTAYVDNTWTIGGLSYSNPSGTFYRNGLADGTFSQVAASDTSGWRLGSDSLVGDVAEIVMYERVLTAAELEKVNCYYAKKYAIAVTGLVCE